MENYYKGKNVEENLDRNKIEIPNLPEDFVWMTVSGGSKMRNVLSFAMKELKSNKVRHMVWTGSGAGLSKAISCAEICKRDYELHQISKICYRKVEEYWEPQVDDLETLVVTREVPMIHILISKDPLDDKEPGYQAPGSYEEFWKSTTGGTEHQKKSVPRGQNTVTRGKRDYLKTKRKDPRYEMFTRDDRGDGKSEKV